MENIRPGQKISMPSVAELLGAPDTDGTEELEISKLVQFRHHPFKVIDDEKMDELADSIKKNGILSPILVRPTPRATYEVVSGHRRVHAAMIAGLKKVPAIVKDMNDDEAVIAMVDANIQREEILPSERAWALRMKFEAMAHQGVTLGHNVPKLENEGSSGHDVQKWTVDVLGEETSMCGRQVKRYIRLTYLIPELLLLLDEKKLQFVSGVEISYMPENIQKWIYEYIKENGCPKPDKFVKLRNIGNFENTSQSSLIDFLSDYPGKKKEKKTYQLPYETVKSFFPANMEEREWESVIVKLLSKWKEENGEGINAV